MNGERPTVGEILERLAGDRAGAWITLDSLARAVSAAVCRARRIPRSDADDIGAIVLLRAVVDDFAAIRRCPASSVASAWPTGIARNVVREWIRARARTPRRFSDEGGSVDGADVASARRSVQPLVRKYLCGLTAHQREVVEALLSGHSERRAAALLGVTRDHVHDVKRRAVERMRSRPRDVSRSDVREWGVAASVASREFGDSKNAQVLELYAAHRSRREIARRTGLTEKSVKERIRPWSRSIPTADRGLKRAPPPPTYHSMA